MTLTTMQSSAQSISLLGLGDREEEPGQAGGQAGEGPGQVRADRGRPPRHTQVRIINPNHNRMTVDLVSREFIL